MEYPVKQAFTPSKGIVKLIKLWYEVTGASEDGSARIVSIRLPCIPTEHKEAWLPASSLPPDKQRRRTEDNSFVPWLGVACSWFVFTECNNKVDPTDLYTNGEIYPCFTSLAEIPAS